MAKEVTYWRPHLWGHHFMIKMDHYNLKFRLEQRITTSPQQHWVSMLLGFDFEVEYRAGALSRATDALSIQEEDSQQGDLHMIDHVCTDILPAVRTEIEKSAVLSELRDRILAREENVEWSVVNGLILYEGRTYLQPTSPLIELVLLGIHDFTHEGNQKTMECIR